MSALTIRPAAEADLPALTALYNHYIAHTPITFDLEPWTLAARREWFSHYGTSGRHRLLVAAGQDGEVLGYASSSKFRPKAAYDTTVETSVYVDSKAHGRGVGSALYAALFEILAGEDVHRAVAGVTLPNEKSLALHTRFGFRQTGIFTEVGRKFDQYWDVAWLEKNLNVVPEEMVAYFDANQRLFVAVPTAERHLLQDVPWSMFTHGVVTDPNYRAIGVTDEHLGSMENLGARFDQAVRRLETYRSKHRLVISLRAHREQIISQWFSSYAKP